MYRNLKTQMKRSGKMSALAVAIAAGAILFSAPAFAISSVDECNAAVKSTTQDLLKANVKIESLGEIDAALIAAEAKCVAQDFSGAEADLANAKALITAAAQN